MPEKEYKILGSIAWIYNGVDMKKAVKDLPQTLEYFVENDKRYKLTIEIIEEEE